MGQPSTCSGSDQGWLNEDDVNIVVHALQQQLPIESHQLAPLCCPFGGVASGSMRRLKAPLARRLSHCSTHERGLDPCSALTIVQSRA